MEFKGRYPIIIIVLLFLLYSIFSISPPILKVHFIDIGQGDAILIQSKGTTILIDGGNRYGWVEERLLKYLKEQKVESIDFIVSTHPHADHIGGLIAVLKNFPVKAVYDSGRSHTSQTYLQYLLLVDDLNIPYYTPRRGDLIKGKDLQLLVLHPAGDVEEYTLNNASIVLGLKYGQISFLFTGDLEKHAEKELLSTNQPLQSTVLKVGHHGSRSSTSEPFLKEVNPKMAIILCGKDNQFGHPHQEVLTLLEDYQIQVFRTDLHGTIVITTDGKGLSVKTESSP